MTAIRSTRTVSRQQATTAARLAALRARIARIDPGLTAADGPGTAAAIAALGLDDIDRHLPGGGLARGAVHEVAAADAGGAALGFALWIVARMAGTRPWLWCSPHDSSAPYAPALADFGLKPQRLLLARTAFERETLWAAEEGLATPALGAVLAEAGAVSDIAARRLAIAARASAVPLILLRDRDAAAIPAASRWRVGAAPEGAWEIALLRAGGVFPRHWRVVWRGAAGALPIPVTSPLDHDHDEPQAKYRPAEHDARDAAGARPVAAAPARGAA